VVQSKIGLEIDGSEHSPIAFAPIAIAGGMIYLECERHHHRPRTADHYFVTATTLSGFTRARCWKDDRNLAACYIVCARQKKPHPAERFSTRRALKVSGGQGRWRQIELHKAPGRCPKSCAKSGITRKKLGSIAGRPLIPAFQIPEAKKIPPEARRPALGDHHSRASFSTIRQDGCIADTGAGKWIFAV